MNVSNETDSSMTRTTKEGRKLTYEMRVLQQPQRARACGSGAKSSADRRPVDPPPVVELRVLEGEAKNDITFSYNSNFFLYTTLESARPIAQGRVPTIAAPPVLTGMPVAGMAYLDRPAPAGYFIFPDLSVRHEGKYRLSFNLFEELKESKDEDNDPNASSESAQFIPNPNNPTAPRMHVHFRLEVKSEPFDVFSAKKFPGLAESTSLSRVVAEQGCRVRIRRDVRMRRRDPKQNKDYEEYDEEGNYQRSDRYVTPDNMYTQQPLSRPRSVSATSVDGHHTPYNSLEQRHPSQESLHYAYQQPPPSMPRPQSVSNGYTSNHLSFGSANNMQYQTPTLPVSAGHMAQPAQTYIPQNSNNFQYPPPTAHARQMSNPQPYGYPAAQMYQPPQQTQAPQQQHYMPGQSNGNPEWRPFQDYRRASLPQSHSNVVQQVPYYQAPPEDRVPVAQPNYYTHPQPPAPRSGAPSNTQLLPPLKTIPSLLDRRVEQPPSANTMSSATTMQTPMTAMSSVTYETPQTANTPHSAMDLSSAYPPKSGSSKRSFSKVFDSTHISQPMQSGMRPDLAEHGQDVAQIELDDGTLEDEDSLASLKLLSYKRADGSRQHKKCPSPISS
ncbi:velvet protein [Bachmanniomyces sp. S44760]|nr:velvet protein [Bachmanniomyces sp. S44760]